MHTVYIGIGSNLGERQKSCERAVELFLSLKIAESVIISNWYETEAMVCHPERSEASPEANGAQDGDPPYMNGAARIETELGPKELLAALHRIETELGRVRTGKKWGPRTIDLDILFYDDLVINTPELVIPHPELHKRRFVLDPLCDIAPDIIHPILGRSIASLKRELIGAEAGSVK